MQTEPAISLLRLWHKETNDLVAGELGGPPDLIP